MRPLLVLAAALALALAPVGDARAEEGCTTADCHATLMKGASVHDAPECGECHQQTDPVHPKRGAASFKLTQPQPALCTECHDAFGTKSSVHQPVAEGRCTSCHSPHASDQPKLLLRPLKELCVSCHPTQVKFAHLHTAVAEGDCTDCHASHESDHAKLLLKEDPELCVECHTGLADAATRKSTHAALETGCTICHDPHGAAEPALLATGVRASCLECHTALADDLGKRAVHHGALDDPKSCVACHTPHGGDQPKLLNAAAAELCLGCHKGLVKKTMKVLHKPFAEGACAACHEPHAAENRKLLRPGMPASPYAQYSDTAYATCFGCHQRELVEAAKTTTATGFRDGERNLHFLHVDRAKGRSCAMCHDMHGSSGPKLVADTVAFGKWRLPVQFAATANGGGCTPGCHEPESYQR